MINKFESIIKEMDSYTKLKFNIGLSDYKGPIKTVGSIYGKAYELEKERGRKLINRFINQLYDYTKTEFDLTKIVNARFNIQTIPQLHGDIYWVELDMIIE